MHGAKNINCPPMSLYSCKVRNMNQSAICP